MAFLRKKNSLSSLLKRDESASNVSINSSLIEASPCDRDEQKPILERAQKLKIHDSNNNNPQLQHQLLDEKQTERTSSNQSNARYGPLLEAHVQESANVGTLLPTSLQLILSYDNHNMTLSAHCLEWLVSIAGFSGFNSKYPRWAKIYSALVFLSIVFSLMVEIYNYNSDTSWLYFAIFTNYIQVLVLYSVAKCKLMPDLYQNTPDGTSIVRSSASSIAHYNDRIRSRGIRNTDTDINENEKQKTYHGCARARAYGNNNCNNDSKHRLQRKSNSNILHDVMHPRGEVISFESAKHASGESNHVLLQTSSTSSTSLGIKHIFSVYFFFALFFL